MQLGIPYALTGPDGTRIVVGNSDAAVADPDWVGYIDADAGITGLDGAEVRENADNLVEQDGGSHGPFWEGRRAVVINLILDPRGRTISDLNALERKVKRASRALRDDAVLRWTPDGVGVELALRLRRQAKVGVAGRRPKTMQLPMVSADSLVRSMAEAQQDIVPGTPVGIIGYSAPYTNPFGTTVSATAAQAFVVNQGDVEAIPRFRIDGPIRNPQILNNSLGLSININYELGAGEWLDVDCGRKTVLLNGTASRFGAVVYPATKWWRLRPGSNDVRLLASAYSAGAKLTVYWRHAFE